MKIKFSEIRRDYTLGYSFESEMITANYNNQITDTFDLSQLAEYEKITNIENNFPNGVKCIKSAKRVDGELEVILFKPHGNLQKINKYNGTDWHGKINELKRKITLVKEKINQATNEKKEQEYIKQLVSHETHIDNLEAEREELKEYCNKFDGIPNREWQVV